MYEVDAERFSGKLVRIRLQRGVLKIVVGVFLGGDSEPIGISELYSYNRFRVRVVPKTKIGSIEPLDLTTGKWPGDWAETPQGRQSAVDPPLGTYAASGSRFSLGRTEEARWPCAPPADAVVVAFVPPPPAPLSSGHLTPFRPHPNWASSIQIPFGSWIYA